MGRRAREKEPEEASGPMSPLQDAIAKIEKKFGKGTIRKGHEVAPVSRVPCGVFALDCALGQYQGAVGFPKGRVTMLVGDESVCKTTLTLLLMGEFQRRGEQAVYIDAEGDWDPSWSRKLGVKVEDVLLQPSESAEQTLDICAELIRAMPNGILAVDSMAALSPTAEIEESFDEWQQGLAARLFNKGWRSFQAGMNTAAKGGDTGPTLLAIQQYRMKIGGQHGPTKTIPGGQGQRFAASVILELKTGDQVYMIPGKGLKAGLTREEFALNPPPVGRTFSFYVLKNKTAPPYRRGEFELYTAHAEDPETGQRVAPGMTNLAEQILRMGVTHGIVQRSGAWYSMGDERLGQGEANAAAFIRMNGELQDRMQSAVLLAEARLSEGP